VSVTRLTFDHLADLEPRLEDLEAAILALRRTRRRGRFCANEVWYRRFKPRLQLLVGWEARGDSVLTTTQAYDTAYEYLYDLLPSCRRCDCL
jgi:hypothetical protein